MDEICDPDMTLPTKTTVYSNSIYSSELLPTGFVDEFRRDRNTNSGGVNHDSAKRLLYDY